MATTKTQTPDPEKLLSELRGMAALATTDAEARQVTSQIASLTRRLRRLTGGGAPPTPAHQAMEVDSRFRMRPHTAYIGEQIAQATRDVEAGENRHLIITCPPRVGKSTLVSLYTPLWLLRKHPDWKIILTSYDVGLTSAWSRTIRTLAEEHQRFGIIPRRDGGAIGHWSTTENGQVTARSLGTPLTGYGANVMIIDDPLKDFAAAHSPVIRESIWNWWLSVAQTRLEPPYLVMVVMTRWHEDDLVGRLLSDDFEGVPEDWQEIRLPAIADDSNDLLEREAGAPLLSPILTETTEEAAARWAAVERSVGSYTYAGMYQQQPAPPKGAIFNVDWWRYWTRDPAKASRTENGDLDPRGKVVLFDPEDALGDRWVDSWDMSFKGTGDSSYVVGQRWVRVGPRKYLIAQDRERLSFTPTLARVLRWCDPTDPLIPYSGAVHERLVEDKANGTAIIDMLKVKVPGLHAINPTDSKVGRARAVSPDVEAGDVFLPLPSDPGNNWVTTDYLPEFRYFPTGSHDDQVDTTTQALTRLRTAGITTITQPGDSGQRIDPRARQRAAAGTLRRVPSIPTIPGRRP